MKKDIDLSVNRIKTGEETVEQMKKKIKDSRKFKGTSTEQRDEARLRKEINKEERAKSCESKTDDGRTITNERLWERYGDRTRRIQ